MCQGILFVLRLFFRTGRLCLSLHRSLLSSIDSGQCQTARLTNSSCNNHEPMKYLNMPTYPTCLTDACVRFLYCATLVRHLLQSISVAYAFDTRNTHPSVTPFQAPVRKPPPPFNTTIHPKRRQHTYDKNWQNNTSCSATTLHQHAKLLVNVEQYDQLRLRGNRKLTRIVTYA